MQNNDEKLYDLKNILSNINNEEGEYFFNFLSKKSMDVGVIKLLKGQQDTQEPHPADEIYFVIKGDGTITINEKKYDVYEGKVIYIPKNVPHRFSANTDELIVLYVIC
ncbi:MAG: cupin domain-containing protein [Nitrososphaeraceae archaeon]